MNKQHRVKDNKDFTRIIHTGKSFRQAALIIYFVKSDQQLKVGLAVSKKVGNAVTTNKIKRQLRSIFRKHINKYPNFEIVAVVRKSYLDYSYDQIDALVEKMLNKLEKTDE